MLCVRLTIPLLLLQAATCLAQGDFSLALPDSVEAPSCAWGMHGMKVSWSAPTGAAADYYEVQVAASKDGQMFLIASTSNTSLTLNALLPNTTYWMRIRAHSKGAPSLGPGTWGLPGPATRCVTGLKDMAHSAASAGLGVKSFSLEVMRQSEYTDDVDYLMNHNSGTVLADVAFLTMTSGMNRTPTGVSFPNSTLTTYCVDVLATNVSGTFSTGGDSRFADYQSCNNVADHSRPSCACDNAIDRLLGGITLDACRSAAGEKCKVVGGFPWDCKCNCTDRSMKQSATYIGMMPLIYKLEGKDVQFGSWFSHPQATECNEFEELGSIRSDGTRCTWKRRPFARVMRGYQVKEHGWNGTTTPGHILSIDRKQVRQNMKAVHDTLAAAPVRMPWSCGSGHPSYTMDERLEEKAAILLTV